MKIVRLILKKEVEKQVIKSKCYNCNIDCTDNCKGHSDRCPSCDESLSNDLDMEFKYCPYCGQKLKY